MWATAGRSFFYKRNAPGAASTLSSIYHDCLHGWCNAVAEMPVRLVGLQLDPFRLAWSDSSGQTREWGRWAWEEVGEGLAPGVLRQHRYNLNLTSEKLWETFSAFLKLWSLPPSSKLRQLLDIHHKYRHQYAHFLWSFLKRERERMQRSWSLNMVSGALVYKYLITKSLWEGVCRYVCYHAYN